MVGTGWVLTLPVTLGRGWNSSPTEEPWQRCWGPCWRFPARRAGGYPWDAWDAWEGTAMARSWCVDIVGTLHLRWSGNTAVWELGRGALGHSLEGMFFSARPDRHVPKSDANACSTIWETWLLNPQTSFIGDSIQGLSPEVGRYATCSSCSGHLAVLRWQTWIKRPLRTWAAKLARLVLRGSVRHPRWMKMGMTNPQWNGKFLWENKANNTNFHGSKSALPKDVPWQSPDGYERCTLGFFDRSLLGRPPARRSWLQAKRDPTSLISSSCFPTIFAPFSHQNRGSPSSFSPSNYPVGVTQGLRRSLMEMSRPYPGLCGTCWVLLFMWVPSGKHTKNYGKSPFLLVIGKSTINGPFSIAM